MADKAATVTGPASPVVSNPEAQAVPAKKGAAAPKIKKPRVKPAHPRTAEMVNAAIQNLNERGGSSLQAIKKYIVATYMVDAERQAPFIKKYLKTAVATGILTQTKGKGASGSFKMSAAKSDAPKAKAPKAAPKPTTPKKKTTAASAVAPAKKPRAPKKAPAPKKTDGSTGEKRAKAPKSPVVKAPKVKSPSKVKKAVKAPTSKPKAPKPKKAAVAAAAAAAPKTVKPAPKKAAASKKK